MRKPVETAVLFVIMCFGIVMMSTTDASENEPVELAGYGKSRLTAACPDEGELSPMQNSTGFSWPEAR